MKQTSASEEGILATRDGMQPETVAKDVLTNEK